jgi:hypothetical protein
MLLAVIVKCSQPISIGDQSPTALLAMYLDLAVNVDTVPPLDDVSNMVRAVDANPPGPFDATDLNAADPDVATDADSTTRDSGSRLDGRLGDIEALWSGVWNGFISGRFN